MRKGSAERMVRRNITLPESVAERLEAIKVARAKVSDSEAIREMISLMEIILDQKNTDLMLKSRETGKETLIAIPR